MQTYARKCKAKEIKKVEFTVFGFASGARPWTVERNGERRMS
jgi:hypothetical protein